MNQPLEGKRVLITGGTGSLGNALVQRILSDEQGHAISVRILSRGESLQDTMRKKFADDRLSFVLGDVRDPETVAGAMRDTEVVIHAAAMKQVPACEYFPSEAVRTNCGGTANIISAVVDLGIIPETVIGISTDKACAPVNVYGMTKSIMERMLVEANLSETPTRFLAVRYGNVMASRGSVIPVWKEQIARRAPVTVTTPDMTRFMLALDEAVDIVFAGLSHGQPGNVMVPAMRSARMADLAAVLIGPRDNAIAYTGIRPGEKVHEALISAEEVERTCLADCDGYFDIQPLLSEFTADLPSALTTPYTSADVVMPQDELHDYLVKHGVAL